MTPKASNVYAARGLAYERKLERELTRLAKSLGGTCEHNPWFEYKIDSTSSWEMAVPDFILRFSGVIIVIETKLTYVPDAIEKLQKTYLPIVRAGLCSIPDVKIFTLVITKTLTPEVSNHITRLAQVCDTTRTPTLQWLGHGQILW